jgi:hypothetical protein
VREREGRERRWGRRGEGDRKDGERGEEGGERRGRGGKGEEGRERRGERRHIFGNGNTVFYLWFVLNCPECPFQHTARNSNLQINHVTTN